ncbi:amino acid transporter AVT1D-like [Zerene cesonia]|uniref:amino acid transporter AVT1D-like n=1 Tax=Zerene cesonia TaxID=33412 RepID=UPI0018E55220|nr:amino acid transporter AVT1D-like [Zerene cesonia]XP_038216231.1 amino acid transporter AVT1D-like [Zerene cesonia]
MAKKNGLEIEAAVGKSEATESTPLVPKGGIDTGDGGGPGKGGGQGGLSVKQTAILVAGEMAGSGVLALPRALVKTGWVGIPIIILMCLIAAFSGKRLGDCWTMVESRNPDMRTRKRNPYAIIANEALGPIWSVGVSLALVVTQFGMSVVYLLLAAQIIEQIFLSLMPNVTICIWYLVVAGAVTPLLLFGTPRDFSLLGFIAFISTVVACVLYFIQMMNDIKPFVFRYGIHGFTDFFLAFGTIMFAFGGASSFPTIQNDMTDRSKFNTSLQYSFLAILALYLPIAVAGYAVYGEAVAPNVAASLSATPLSLVGNVLMAVHLLAAFIILVNPVCQEMEELYSVPMDSVGYRTLVRLSIIAGILFIGESIPRFYTILALVGGTTIALLTFTLPSYCYLSLLNKGSGEGQPPFTASGWTKLFCWEVITVGVVGGIFATYSALSAIFSTAQAVPCYLR